MKRILILVMAACCSCASHNEGQQASIIAVGPEAVKDCTLLNEFDASCHKIANGKAIARGKAYRLGATHIVWDQDPTDPKALKATSRKSGVYVSGKAYRCEPAITTSQLEPTNIPEAATPELDPEINGLNP